MNLIIFITIFNTTIALLSIFIGISIIAKVVGRLRKPIILLTAALVFFAIGRVIKIFILYETVSEIFLAITNAIMILLILLAMFRIKKAIEKIRAKK